MGTRYELLPFLYTLFFLAHRDGDTVMRPLSFEFPCDAELRSADRQFLWGSALLITPVLDKGATSVTAIVPSKHETEGHSTKWYSYYTGKQLVADSTGVAVLDAPLEGPINVHVRGGSVLPTQTPNSVPPITTANSRGNPFGLTVALDAVGVADGLAYFDDGESLDSIDSGSYTLMRITVLDGVLSANLEAGRTISDSEVLGSVRVFGLMDSVTSVSVRDNKLDASKWSYDGNLGVLSLADLATPLADAFPITFNTSASQALLV